MFLLRDVSQTAIITECEFPEVLKLNCSAQQISLLAGNLPTAQYCGDLRLVTLLIFRASCVFLLYTMRIQLGALKCFIIYEKG